MHACRRTLENTPVNIMHHGDLVSNIH